MALLTCCASLCYIDNTPPRWRPASDELEAWTVCMVGKYSLVRDQNCPFDPGRWLKLHTNSTFHGSTQEANCCSWNRKSRGCHIRLHPGSAMTNLLVILTNDFEKMVAFSFPK